MKRSKYLFIASVFFGAIMFSAGSASASSSYGFDDSEVFAPIVLEDGAITLTSDDVVSATGDANNGDPGGWSLIARSSPNILKIWDNLHIAMTSPSDGFGLYCTSGNLGATTLTITTYLNGVVVDGPTTQDLGALNELESVTSGSNSPIDEINIVGRLTGDPTSLVPFGCDDLTLSLASATTTTEAVTTTTEADETSTTAGDSTTVAPRNELAETGTNGSYGGFVLVVLLISGFALMFVSRYRTDQQ